MAQPQDALAFQREIRVAEFWRHQLGELEYSQRDPNDLYRWYEAMELRGPDEIRAYVNERTGRYPTMPVTGIVAIAPHPTREIIDIWLASHEKVHTGHYWTGAAALLVVCIWVVPKLHGCQILQSPNPPQAWLPQAATLTAGTIAGSPTPLSTNPTQLPSPPVSFASPSATSIATRNGSGAPRSTALGAQMGISRTSAPLSSSSSSGPSVSVSTPGATAMAPLASFSSQGTRQH